MWIISMCERHSLGNTASVCTTTCITCADLFTVHNMQVTMLYIERTLTARLPYSSSKKLLFIPGSTGFILHVQVVK